MKRRRRTEITIETHQVIVLRRPKGAVRAWCAACALEAQMVMPEAAAAITGASTRAVYRRVEAGRLHFTETTEGGLLICLPSLLLSAG